MSNRTLAILAGACALVLTFGAWWQVMSYKNPSHVNLALWLPLIVLFRAHDAILPIFISFLQFPLLAAGFILASRRWKPWWVLAASAVFYASCVWGAMAMLKAGFWN